MFWGPGQPGDPLVLSDCISCNVGKGLSSTISLCSWCCFIAGSNNSHKAPVSVCCIPAGHLQMAAGTSSTSLRVESLTNITYIHLKTWRKLFGLLVFHSLLCSYCRLKTTIYLCRGGGGRMQNTCSTDHQMLIWGLVKRDLREVSLGWYSPQKQLTTLTGCYKILVCLERVTRVFLLIKSFCVTNSRVHK